MSTVTASSKREHRVTARSLARCKRRGEPFSMLTAYDFAFSRIFDQAGIDVLLVGDSMGNVVQGKETTLPVTLDEVVYHSRMVVRGASRALVVGDMPFGSYQVSPEDAVRSAIRLVKEGGVHSVKLEGGRNMSATIERIVSAEIPVMGHVGLTPQSIHPMGGYRVQGRGEQARQGADRGRPGGAGRRRLLHRAGGGPGGAGGADHRSCSIPTIGIGAGPDCDGQVLVIHDLLG